MKKDFLQILAWTILWTAEIKEQLYLFREKHKNARQELD